MELDLKDMNNKILIHLSHPAHYFLFKEIAAILSVKSYSIYYTIKQKDVLSNLLENNNIRYFQIKSFSNNSTSVTQLFNIIHRSRQLYRIAKIIRPKIILSSSPEASIIGRILGIPSLLFAEDDYKEVKKWYWLSGIFSSKLVIPSMCDANMWKFKTIYYNGYHELSYLNPKVFNKNKHIVHKYYHIKYPYFILRFAKCLRIMIRAYLELVMI